jgi:hypothetical protein
MEDSCWVYMYYWIYKLQDIYPSCDKKKCKKLMYYLYEYGLYEDTIIYNIMVISFFTYSNIMINYPMDIIHYIMHMFMDIHYLHIDEYYTHCSGNECHNIFIESTMMRCVTCDDRYCESCLKKDLLNIDPCDDKLKCIVCTL